MPKITKKQIALLHVAKKDSGLDDDTYRDILRFIGGRQSSKDLDQPGFAAVMEHFHKLGFQSDFAKANQGHREGKATPSQVALIRDLWSQFTEAPCDDLALGKWMERQFKISSVLFADAETATKAIGALKNMNARRKG